MFLSLDGSYSLWHLKLFLPKRLELYFNANDFHLSFRSNLELYFLGMFYNFSFQVELVETVLQSLSLNKTLLSAKITSSLFNDRLRVLAICIDFRIFIQFTGSQILPILFVLFSGRIFLSIIF